MHIFDHVGLDPIEMNAEMIDGKDTISLLVGISIRLSTMISNNSKKQASLARWRNRVGKEKAQATSTRAAGRGTRYHKLVEDYINNELDTKSIRTCLFPGLCLTPASIFLTR